MALPRCSPLSAHGAVAPSVGCMKAAVYDTTGGPEVFRYADIDEPQLRKGGVLIDVRFVGIQGGDLLHRARGVLATNPHVVGYQASGIVRAVGDGVTAFVPGQPVVATMGFGSHAEVVSVPAGSVWAVPDGVSLEQAAGVPIEALETAATLPVPAALLGAGEHYALEVSGDSMIEAGIFDGDFALIRKTDTARDGEIIVALVRDEEATLKYLRRENGMVRLDPANAAYEPQIYRPDEVRVQGKLAGLLRRYH